MDAVLGASVTAAAAVVYAATGHAGVAGGDSGEFVAEACLGGVPHPPGYPLVRAWGGMACWAASALCDADAGLQSLASGSCRAAVINSAFAIFPAAALGLCAAASFLVARARAGDVGAAAIGLLSAWTLGTSRVFWTYAGHAEVFGMNNAAVMAIVWGLARFEAARRLPPNEEGKAPSAIWSHWLAALCALGASNQHTVVFVVVPVAVWVAGALWYDGRLTVKHTLAVAACGVFTAGTAYATLAWASWTPVAGSWGDLTSFSGFFRHVLRAEYGTLQLAAVRGDAAGAPMRWAAYLHHASGMGPEAAPGHSSWEGVAPRLASGGWPEPAGFPLLVALGALSALGRTAARLVCGRGASGAGGSAAVPAVVLASLAVYIGAFGVLANVDPRQAMAAGVLERFWMQADCLAAVLMAEAVAAAVAATSSALPAAAAGATSSGRSALAVAVVALLLARSPGLGAAACADHGALAGGGGAIARHPSAAAMAASLVDPVMWPSAPGFRPADDVTHPSGDVTPPAVRPLLPGAGSPCAACLAGRAIDARLFDRHDERSSALPLSRSFPTAASRPSRAKTPPAGVAAAAASACAVPCARPGGATADHPSTDHPSPDHPSRPAPGLAVQRFAVAALESLPRGALALAHSDLMWNAVRATQASLGARPDVQTLSLQLLPYPWARRQARLYPGVVVPPLDPSRVSTDPSDPRWRGVLTAVVFANRRRAESPGGLFVEMTAIGDHSLGDGASLGQRPAPGGGFASARLVPHGLWWRVVFVEGGPGRPAASLDLRAALWRRPSVAAAAALAWRVSRGFCQGGRGGARQASGARGMVRAALGLGPWPPAGPSVAGDGGDATRGGGCDGASAWLAPSLTHGPSTWEHAAGAMAWSSLYQTALGLLSDAVEAGAGRVSAETADTGAPAGVRADHNPLDMLIGEARLPAGGFGARMDDENANSSAAGRAAPSAPMLRQVVTALRILRAHAAAVVWDRATGAPVAASAKNTALAGVMLVAAMRGAAEDSGAGRWIAGEPVAPTVWLAAMPGAKRKAEAAAFAKGFVAEHAAIGRDLAWYAAVWPDDEQRGTFEGLRRVLHVDARDSLGW